MNRVLRGVVHGRTVALDTETGLKDGRTVEIVLRAKELPGPPPGWEPDGKETAAGMMASDWTDEDDRLLDQIYQDRKKNTRRELP